MDEQRKKMFADFSDVKVGDTIHRMLAGKVHMALIVTEVTDTLIVAGMGWSFDRKTGIEEDEDIGWGIKFGKTGSYLVKEAPDVK